jgi:2-haloacid dehalogenase
VPADAVLVFDVNETLLDLRGLEPLLEEVLGSPPPLGEWFARLLHGSVVANYTNRYRSFGEIGVEVLTALARRRRVELDAKGAQEIVGAMLSLPPHPEVRAAMERLSAKGYRMATLTNSSSGAVQAQMANAGLERYLEAMISVDEVRLFKPAPEVYQMAAARLGIEMEKGLLIASHDWDVIGARAAGMAGAYLARPGTVWSLPDAQPDLVAPDLAGLAELLIG